MIYSLEKLIQDNRDKIPADEINHLQQEMANTKKAMESDNLEDIKRATEALARASHHISEVLYSQASSQQQPGPKASLAAIIRPEVRRQPVAVGWPG
jgi:molecular chaperone DnaK